MMTDNDRKITMNDDTLVAIYDDIPYIWHDNAWHELDIEVMSTGGEK